MTSPHWQGKPRGKQQSIHQRQLRRAKIIFLEWGKGLCCWRTRERNALCCQLGWDLGKAKGPRHFGGDADATTDTAALGIRWRVSFPSGLLGNEGRMGNVLWKAPFPQQNAGMVKYSCWEKKGFSGLERAAFLLGKVLLSWCVFNQCAVLVLLYSEKECLI